MKKIEVFVRATGVIAMIDEGDFDEALHAKVVRDAPKKKDDDDKGLVRTIGDLTPEEFAKGIGSATVEAMRGVLKELGVGEADLDADGKPRRIVSDSSRNADEPVNRWDDTTIAYGRAGRAIPGFEAQYKKLPEAERAIRSPEGDVYSMRVMTAIAMKDPSLLNELKSHELKRFGDLDQNDPFIRATMGTTSTAVGGALVPSPLADLIILKRDARERLLPRSMQLTTEAETLTVPNEATVGAVAGTAENATIGQTDSTLGDTVLTKKKVARIAKSSKELLGSISGAFSLSNILSNQAARKMAVYFDLQGAQNGDGTGTNHTNSIVNATITTVAAVTGALTRAKIIQLLHGLPTEWRDGTQLTFMGNSALTTIIANLVDSNGRPFYLPTDVATRPMSDVGNATNIVEGIPYIELPFTANLLWIAVLNEGFAVLNGGGMRIDMTDVGAGTFENDQVAWKFVERRDSAVVNTDAFREAAGVLT